MNTFNKNKTLISEKGHTSAFFWKGLLLFVFVSLFTVSQAQIEKHVEFSFTLNDLPTAEKEILLTATIDKGWHLYDMNLPSDGPNSTAITFETVKGAELTGKPTTSVKPTVLYDPNFDMELRWFADKVTFIQKIKVTDFKKFKVAGEIEFQACNDEMCLPPERIPFEFGSKDIKNVVQNTPAAPKADDTLKETVTDVATEDLTLVNDDSAKKSVADVTAVIKQQGNNSSPNSSVADVEDVSLWTPVIEELKALGDTTASTTDNSYLYIFIA
ncbi:MAG: protein-disulfide reductase DsbD N-terminal domain-containing protein, partial [Tannerella sp.]|nr:protein-disulfide reductase DsbD N-terminal domain-containing protein [Tannerella sp.]